MRYFLLLRNAVSLLALVLLAGCPAPDHQPTARPARPAPAAAPAGVPGAAASHAFLRQVGPLTMRNYPGFGDDGEFFLRQPYVLDANVAAKLQPAPTVPGRLVVDGSFQRVPPAVLQGFRQQVLRLGPAAQRRLAWQPALLPWFVLVDSTGQHLPPALATQLRRPSAARQQALTQAIATWNRTPQSERFVSYASWPLFSPGGRYALIVRGQAQQSIGWDAVFIYQQTPQGWQVVEAVMLTTI